MDIVHPPAFSACRSPVSEVQIPVHIPVHTVGMDRPCHPVFLAINVVSEALDTLVSVQRDRLNATSKRGFVYIRRILYLISRFAH